MLDNLSYMLDNLSSNKLIFITISILGETTNMTNVII